MTYKVKLAQRNVPIHEQHWTVQEICTPDYRQGEGVKL